MKDEPLPVLFRYIGKLLRSRKSSAAKVLDRGRRKANIYSGRDLKNKKNQ